MIKTTELCLVCGMHHAVGMQCPDSAVVARLTDALDRIIAESNKLLFDEFKFNGDEIHGPRK